MPSLEERVRELELWKSKVEVYIKLAAWFSGIVALTATPILLMTLWRMLFR